MDNKNISFQKLNLVFRFILNLKVCFKEILSKIVTLLFNIVFRFLDLSTSYIFDIIVFLDEQIFFIENFF